VTPAERVRDAVARNGVDPVVTWCAAVLTGDRWDGPTGDLNWVADAAVHSDEWLANPVNGYWPRVWAARALLYAWRPYAVPAVVAGLSDEAWRVREMCAKVARLREIGEAGDTLADLARDPVTRVRVAAVRALALVGESEHVAAVTSAADDPEPAVRKEADAAKRTMEKRLDRPL
jgi:hypothetical protein